MSFILFTGQSLEIGFTQTYSTIFLTYRSLHQNHIIENGFNTLSLVAAHESLYFFGMFYYFSGLNLVPWELSSQILACLAFDNKPVQLEVLKQLRTARFFYWAYIPVNPHTSCLNNINIVHTINCPMAIPCIVK